MLELPLFPLLELEPPPVEGLLSSQRHRTMQVAVRSPAVTVILAVPGATAVTLPFWSTVATFSLPEVKVTFWPEGWTVAFRVWLEPAENRVKSLVSREREASAWGSSVTASPGASWEVLPSGAGC